MIKAQKQRLKTPTIILKEHVRRTSAAAIHVQRMFGCVVKVLDPSDPRYHSDTAKVAIAKELNVLLESASLISQRCRNETISKRLV